MQGELIIGTKIDDSGFDKDYEKLKNKANNNEIEVSGKTTEQLQRELKSLTQKLDEINEKTETLKDKKIKIDLELKDTYSKEMEEIAEQYNYATSPNFEFQFSNDPTYNMPTLQKTLDWLDPIYQKKIDDVNRKYQEQINSLNEINKKILSNKDASEEIRKKVEITTKELEKKKFSSILENASDSIKNVGKSVERIIKRIGRWALAIFGIRSAYMAVRNAINVISQDDEQLKADIDYMKKAFAYVLEPIARKIVEWAKQLMIYLGYIIKAWTGRNIFENANKSLAGANKNAKELQKTTAGFDEMNLLNDESSSDASAGIGGPSFDLSQIQDVPKPWWVEWIANNKELILTIAGIIGSLFAANKLGKILEGIGAIMGAPNGTGLLGMLGTLGQIALIAGGIVITGYIASKFLKDIKNLKKEIAGVNEAARQGVPEYIKQTDDLKQLENDLNVQRTAGYKILFNTSLMTSKILGLTESYNDTLKTNVGNADKFLQKEMEIYNTGKLQTDEKQKLLDELAQEKQYIDAVINQLEVQGQDTSELKRIQENYNQAIAKMVLDLGTKTPQAYDILRQKMESYLNSGMSKTQAVMATMRDLNNMKLNNKSMTIDLNADTSQAERSTSNWIYNIKRLINNVLPGVGAGGLAITRMLTQGFAKGGIIYPHVPKLASGGIINMPGRGVPLSGAYGGERGAEGVIPLTDSQQMMLLGEAIGKYITINANIINSMNGRVISRELQRVQNDSDFAYNR